jgi:hypothetical protein
MSNRRIHKLKIVCITEWCMNSKLWTTTFHSKLLAEKWKKIQWTGHHSVQRNSHSGSESRYHRRSVSQSVLVSSPIWGSWPEVKYCLTVRVFWSRALSQCLTTIGGTQTNPHSPLLLHRLRKKQHVQQYFCFEYLLLWERVYQAVA